MSFEYVILSFYNSFFFSPSIVQFVLPALYFYTRKFFLQDVVVFSDNHSLSQEILKITNDYLNILGRNITNNNIPYNPDENYELYDKEYRRLVLMEVIKSPENKLFFLLTRTSIPFFEIFFEKIWSLSPYSNCIDYKLNTPIVDLSATYQLIEYNIGCGTYSVEFFKPIKYSDEANDYITPLGIEGTFENPITKSLQSFDQLISLFSLILLKTINSSDSIGFRNSLNNIYVKCPTGDFTIAQDNHILTKSYAITKYPNEIFILIKQISDNFMSYPFRELFQYDQYEVCKIGDGESRGIARNIMEIYFSVNSISKESPEQIDFIVLFDTFIEILNYKQQLVDLHFIKKYIKPKLTTEEYLIVFDRILEKKQNTNIIFAISDYEVLSIIDKDEKYKSFIIFMPYLSSGLDCFQSVIKTGIVLSEYSPFVIANHKKRFLGMPILILISNKKEYVDIGGVLLNGFLSEGIDISGYYVISYDDMDMIGLVNYVISIIPLGGIVINIMKPQYALKLCESMYLRNLVPPVYINTLLTIDLTEFNENTFEYLKGNYIWTTDYKKYKENFMDKDVKSVLTFFDYKSIDISSSLLLLDIVFCSYSFYYSSMKTNLRQYKVKTVHGEISFNKNFALPQYLIFGFFNSTKMEIIYSSNSFLHSNSLTPFSFSIPEECSIENDELNTTKLEYFVIGLIVSNNIETEAEQIVFEINIDLMIKIMNYELHGIFYNDKAYKLIYQKFEIPPNLTSNYSQVFETILLSNDIIAVFGCTDSQCLQQGQLTMVNKNLPIFFTDRIHDELCLENVINTGLVPSYIYPQIIETINRLEYPNVVLLYKRKSDIEQLINIFKKMLDPYPFNITVLNIPALYILDIATMKAIVALKTNIVVVTYISLQSLEALYNYLNVDSQSTAFIYAIYPINLEISHIQNRFKPSKKIYFYLNEQYDMMSTDESILNYKNMIMNYNNVITPSGITHSIYCCFLTLKKLIEISNSIDFRDYKSYISKIELYVPMGSLSYGANHVLSENICSYFMLNSVITKLHCSTNPYFSNFANSALMSSRDKMCDLDSNGFVTINSIRILFAISLSGNFSYWLRNLVTSLYLGIREYGKLGIGDIYYDLVNIESDDLICYNKIANKLNDKKRIYSIFTTCSAACRKSLIHLLERTETLLFSFYYINVEEANKNIFLCGLTAEVYLNSIESMQIRGYMRYLMIVENTAYARAYYKIISLFFSKRSGKITSMLIVRTDEENFDPFIKALTQDELYDAVFLLVNDLLHIKIDYQLRLYNLKNGKSYEKIFLSVLSSEVAMDSVYYPFLTIQFAFDYDLTEDQKILKKKFNDLIIGNSPFSSLYQIPYSVMSFWINAMSKFDRIESYDIIKMRSYLYEKYDSFIGEIRFKTNNLLSANLKYSFSKYTTSESSSPLEFKAYLPLLNNEYILTNFKEENIGDKFVVPSIKIGFLYIKENGAEKGRRDVVLISSISFAIELLNRKAVSNLSVYKLISMATTIENYEKDLISLLNREDTVINIGGYSLFEREIIIKNTNFFKRYWIFLGFTKEISCYKYIINLNIASDQLLYIASHTILQSSKIDIILLTGISELELYHAKRYEEQSSKFGILSFTVIEVTGDSISRIKETLSFKSNYVLLTCILSENEFLKEVVDIFALHNPVDEDILFIHTLVDEAVFLRFTLIPFEGHHFIMSYSKALENDQDPFYEKRAKDFNMDFYNFFGDEMNPFSISEFTYSFLSLFSEIGTSYSYLKMPDKISRLYGVSKNTPSGVMMLENNNYINRRVYDFEIINGGIRSNINIEVMLYTRSYMFNNFSTVFNECNWDKGGVLENRPTKIVLTLFEKDSSYLEISLYNLYIYENFFQLANRIEFEMYKYYIIPQFFLIDVKNEKEAAESLRAVLSSSDKYTAIFGCLKYSCMKIVNEAIKDNSITYYFYGKTPSNTKIYGHQINMHSSAYQRAKFIGNFISYKNYPYFYLIRDSSPLLMMDSTILTDYFQSNVNTQFAGITSVTMSLTYGELHNVFSDLIKSTFSLKSLIIIMVEYNIAVKLSEYIATIKDELNVYPCDILLYNYHPHFFKGKERFVSNFLVFTSFYVDTETNSNLAYQRILLEQIGANFQASESTDSCLVALQLFRLSIYKILITDNNEGWPDNTNVFYSSLNISLPSGNGMVQLDSSGFFSRQYFIVVLTTNGGMKRIFPQNNDTVLISNENNNKEVGDGVGTIEIKINETMRKKIIHIIILTLNTLIWLICFILVLKNRKSVVFTAFGTSFHFFLLFSTFLFVVITFLLVLAPISNEFCRIIQIFLSYSFLLLYCTLFTRSISFYFISNQKKQRSYNFNLFMLSILFVTPLCIGIVLVQYFSSVTHFRFNFHFNN